jgi:hypothetical protein
MSIRAKIVILTIGCCLLVTAMAMAAEPAAATAATPAVSAVPAPLFLAARITPKTTCYVTKDCDWPPPSSVSCTSTAGNCAVGGGMGTGSLDYVECDNIFYFCNACANVPTNCEDPQDWCECRAAGHTAFQCRGWCFDIEPPCHPCQQ